VPALLRDRATPIHIGVWTSDPGRCVAELPVKRGCNPPPHQHSAFGFEALSQNVFVGYNAASGYQALFLNNGTNNTASGYAALYSNSGGDGNTAIGAAALYYNTIGAYNTASGYGVLFANTNGATIPPPATRRSTSIRQVRSIPPAA
jgi:hypothetical protein